MRMLNEKKKELLLRQYGSVAAPSEGRHSHQQQQHDKEQQEDE
jgi:hypothetical protein